TASALSQLIANAEAAALLCDRLARVEAAAEEQREKLSGVAYPITSKLYSGGAGGMPDYGDDDDDASGHDEL
ncbi:MAG: ATPase with role in protein import into the ER, partial [Watsoniomyces obsoletus]